VNAYFNSYKASRVENGAESGQQGFYNRMSVKMWSEIEVLEPGFPCCQKYVGFLCLNIRAQNVLVACRTLESTCPGKIS